MLPDSVCVACYITVVLTIEQSGIMSPAFAGLSYCCSTLRAHLLLALATSPELPQLPALARMLKFGTPPRSRTERTLPFERSDFARFVQRGIDWRRAEESNPIPLSENRVFKARRRTIPPALLSINCGVACWNRTNFHEFSAHRYDHIS